MISKDAKIHDLYEKHNNYKYYLDGQVFKKMFNVEMPGMHESVVT